MQRAGPYQRNSVVMLVYDINIGIVRKGESHGIQRSEGNRPDGYKTFSMLNSAGYEMCPANKS